MNEQTYTRLAVLLNAVDEIDQNFDAGELTAEMVAHLVNAAYVPEIRELARFLRQSAKAADGQNP